jgi:hypothetical protein
MCSLFVHHGSLRARLPISINIQRVRDSDHGLSKTANGDLLILYALQTI